MKTIDWRIKLIAGTIVFAVTVASLVVAAFVTCILSNLIGLAFDWPHLSLGQSTTVAVIFYTLFTVAAYFVVQFSGAVK